jgi:alpha-1,6-mannosyltransferase
MTNKYNFFFFSTAAVIEVFLIIFVFLNGEGNIPLYMFIYSEMFLLLLIGLFLVKKKILTFRLPYTSRLLNSITKIEGDLSVPGFIIITGLIFRLTLFPANLTTSPDAYRYIWEGKVILNGYNPYEYEPVNPELRKLHTADLPSKITYNEMKAIYPPVSQFTFAAAYFLAGDRLWGLKLIFFIAEALSLIFLLKLLHLKRKDPGLVILYAWLPLPVMEYFINTHLDALGISFFIIFLYLFETGSYYKSAVLFSLSFLSRFFPLFIFPLIMKKLGIQRTLVFGLILSGITIIFYSPFLQPDLSIFDFLLRYLQRWEFNASVYYFLKLFMSNEAARLLCAIMFISAAGLITRFYTDFSKAALGILIAFIIFTSTVYPWYLGWIGAINPLYGLLSVTSILFTSNLTNFTPLSPVWKEFTIVLLIEYVTFFILLAADYKKRIRKPLQDFSQEL